MKKNYFPALFLFLLMACVKQSGTQLEIKSSIKNSTANLNYIGFDSYGQSLSVGGDGGVPNLVVSNKQNYNSVMFNTGVRTSGLKDPHPAYFVPLIEQLSPNKALGETPCTGASDMFCQSFPDKTFQLFASASGQSSQSVANLSKPLAFYTRLISNMKIADSIAMLNAQSFSMGAIFYTQGEADYTGGTSYDNYKATLNQLMLDVNTDAGILINQVDSIPFIVGQCSSQNRTPAGMSNAAISLAQLDLSTQQSNFTLATPMYMFDFLRDNTHLGPAYYRILGAYYGYAFKKLMVDGVKNFIYPTAHQLINNTVTLSFNVPVQPLVFDTVRVKNPGSYGFTAHDINGKVIEIKSIQIITGNTIVINCATTPSDITYAINGQAKKAGRSLGPRGCLRDSQGDALVFDPSGSNWPMYNWTPICKIQL